MPMEQESDFGTNAGSRNAEYCTYCYQNGAFTKADITLQQMIDTLVAMAPKMDMSAEDARKLAEEVLPQLKRWKQGS